jgi:hypothetical protein
MAKGKGKSKRLSEINMPTWILWAVIISFVYAVSLFVAYDVGTRAPKSKYEGVKAKEVKRGKGDPITVPLFIPPEKVSHHPRFHFTFDNKEVLRPLRTREQLDKVVTGAKTDIAVFLQLMAWVRSQWSPNRPDPYPPIDAIVILDKIRGGRGGWFLRPILFCIGTMLAELGVQSQICNDQRT